MSARPAPVITLSLQALLVTVSNLQAATITVDPAGGADFLVLQAGIDSAAVGDTVLAAAATYTGIGNKNLTFGGKDIVLRSAYGAAVTIIDGQGTGRAFTFNGGESNAAIVEGFTITRAPAGSPIRITGGSSPTIRDCVIEYNDVTTGPGGAAYVSSSSPVFDACVIAANTTTDKGGAVYISAGSPTFTDCAFIGNLADALGGAFWVTNAALINLSGCTIVGNRADESDGGYNAGGLGIAGGSTAHLNTSILWGNRADQGDEAFVLPGAQLSFWCCVLDSSGLDGGGTISWDAFCTFSDPHFCLPAYCRLDPWAHGDYTLAANSPCLAANSACGSQIGTYGVGCDTVFVWTGAAGTTDWMTASNWSTHAVPDSGDHAQLTGGNVELDAAAPVGYFTQCPESAEPDTFTIRDNGLLSCFGIPTLRQTDTVAVQASGQLVIERGGYITPESEGGDCRRGDCYPPTRITETGVLQNLDGGFLGAGHLIVEGRYELTGMGTCTQDFYLENLATGLTGSPPTGVYLLQGRVDVTDYVDNSGLFVVAGGADLNLVGHFVNLGGGITHLVGDITGGGIYQNLGLVERFLPTRADGDTSAVSAGFVNDRNAGASEAGEIDVLSGTLCFAGDLTNRGDLDVAPGATLILDSTATNEMDGVLTLAGDVDGVGTFHNFGVLTKVGTGTSALTPMVVNDLDTATGARGALLLDSGSLDVASVDNDGLVTIASGTSLNVSGDFTNRDNAVLGGSGTFDASGATVSHGGFVSPGLSPGSLDYIGHYTMTSAGELLIEIGGRNPGTEHDQLNVTGGADLDGALHVRLTNGFLPAIGDTFIVITRTGPGPISGFDCFSGLQLPGDVYLQPIQQADRLLLTAVSGWPPNTPPDAARDTVTTDWPTPVTFAPLANDDDVDPLRLVHLTLTATHGHAIVDAGDTSITYFPPSSYVSVDSLVYAVTDCNGGVDSAVVIVTLDDPTAIVVGRRGMGGRPLLHPVYPNPFGPLTRIRFDLPERTPVTVSIYNVQGRRVCTLARGALDAGTHIRDWSGRDDTGTMLAAGVYFVRMEAPGQVETRKVILVR